YFGLGRIGAQPVAEPGTVLPCLHAGAETLTVAWTVAGDHIEELRPVRFREVMAAFLFVPRQAWIRDGQPKVLRLRYGLIDELLPQLVVGIDLDLPGYRLSRVDGVLVRRAEHHKRRIPEAVQRILRHRLLRGRALGHLHHDRITLPLVKALLLADPHHRPAVRAVRRSLQRHLVHDRGAIHQPP